MKPVLQIQMQRVESKIEIDVQEDPDEIKHISCLHTIKLESPSLESSKCRSSPVCKAISLGVWLLSRLCRF